MRCVYPEGGVFATDRRCRLEAAQGTYGPEEIIAELRKAKLIGFDAAAPFSSPAADALPTRRIVTARHGEALKSIVYRQNPPSA